MATLLIELKKTVNEVKGELRSGNVEQKAELDLYVFKADRYIEDTVTEIAQSPENLMKFAYELRKQDIDDEFSYGFLNGQVKPAILQDIILSNKWSKAFSKMVVKESEAAFSLRIGEQASSILYKKSVHNQN